MCVSKDPRMLLDYDDDHYTVWCDGRWMHDVNIGKSEETSTELVELIEILTGEKCMCFAHVHDC